MNKKQLVIQIIDNLIKEGEDFSDLTQGYLSELTELRGVSHTTIKRAKNEYKKQNSNIKTNYKEQRLKKRIYKYLDRHPKATLGDLREEFPNIIPPKVSEYHLFWKRKQEKKFKKDRQAAANVTPRKLKEIVFKYLDENPQTTSEQLSRVFENANRNSVNSYYNNWKRKQLVDKESVKKGSLVQVLFDYLDRNPGATVRDLQKAFKDVHKKSIEIYYSLWQKKHKESEVLLVETIAQEMMQQVDADFDGGKEQSGKIEIKDAGRNHTDYKSADYESQSEKNRYHIESGGKPDARAGDAKNRANNRIGLRKRNDKSNVKISRKKVIGEVLNPTETDALDQDLISTLEKTIAAQKALIDVLKFEQVLLKSRKDIMSMASFEFSEAEFIELNEFIEIFLQGFRQSNTDASLQ